MIVNRRGPARLELRMCAKKEKSYVVKVILGIVCHRRKFASWREALEYSYGLGHFGELRHHRLPPGNYVFLI